MTVNGQASLNGAAKLHPGKRDDRHISEPFGTGGGGLTIQRHSFSSPSDANTFNLALIARVALGGDETIKYPFEQNPWVYRCVRKIERAIASAPLKLKATEQPDAEDVSIEHPLWKLFRRPLGIGERQQTFRQFLAAGAVHMKLSGEDFWFLTDKGGNPIEVSSSDKIRLPERVYSVIGSAVGDERDDLERVVAWRPGSSGALFPTGSVVHFADYSPRDPGRGLGDLASLARSIAIQFKSERVQAGILDNGGDLGGWIEIPGKMDPALKRSFRNDINAQIKTPENTGRIQVFDNGSRYHPNAIPPKDMEFQAGLSWIRDLIAHIFGVPLPLLGVLDQATYSNAEQTNRFFYEHTIIPYLEAWEDVANECFVARLADPSMARMRFRFDRDAIEALRRDQTEKLKAAATMAQQRVGLSFNGAALTLGVQIPEGQGSDVVLEPLEAELFPAGEDVEIDGEEPAAVAPSAGGAPQGEQGVAASGQLNGAQISAAIDVVAKVRKGDLHRDSGIAILVNFFGLTPETAESVMGSAGLPNKPTTPNPVGDAPAGEPAPNDPPAADEPEPEPEPEEEPDDVDDGDDDTEENSAGPVETHANHGSTAAERHAYWSDYAHRVLDPAQRSIRRAVLAWLRKYELAQVKRLEAIAGAGESKQRAVRQRNEPHLRKRHDLGVISEAEIRELLLLNEAEWKKKLGEATAEPIRAAFARAGRDAARLVGGFALPMNDPRVVQYLAAQHLQLSGVADTLADQIHARLVKVFASASPDFASLQQAVLEELPALRETVADLFASRNARASMIARTESGKAVSGSRQMAFRANDVTATEWITSRDGEVREDHADIDGTQVPLDQSFIPGANLKYPHDPDADASLVINCRCTSRPVFAEESPEG